MPKLIWDEVGKKTYEGGINQGVIYKQNGQAIPWNGLVSVVENSNHTATPVYFDGMKISNFTTPGVFSATISAITFPDGAASELTGVAFLNSAIYITDQRPEPFHLVYKTYIGNDLDGESAGYKIHIIYNVTAIPSQRTYQSFNNDPSLVEFSWDITTIQQEILGFLPSSHFVVDSTKLEPALLLQIENILYGTELTNPYLPGLDEFVSLVSSWYKIQVIDNDDGTWTATTLYDGYITLLEDGKFRIDGIDATLIDANTYIISDTRF